MPEVVVGRLVRAHGLHGEVAVDVRTDEPDRRFARGTVVTLRRPQAGVPLPAALPASLTVASTRWHQHRLLVRFDEIGDRGAAEAVRGLVLVVDLADDEAPTDPDEFYDHQLVGLRVHTTDGRAAGEVVDVLHSGPQDLLVVRRDATDGAPGAEVLVPFVGPLVPEVDLEKRRLVVADRPGLLDPESGTGSESGED
jgi:16S rRNA processing protein RimM